MVFVILRREKGPVKKTTYTIIQIVQSRQMQHGINTYDGMHQHILNFYELQYNTRSNNDHAQQQMLQTIATLIVTMPTMLTLANVVKNNKMT